MGSLLGFHSVRVWGENLVPGLGRGFGGILCDFREGPYQFK